MNVSNTLTTLKGESKMKEGEQDQELSTVEEVRQHVMQQLQDRYMSFQEHIARRNEKLGGDDVAS